MRRGNAMLLVLMVVFVLGVLATSALALLRPVQRNLDERAALQQAGLVADSALQLALANAQQGKTDGFSHDFRAADGHSGRANVRVKVIDAKTLEIGITVSLHDAEGPCAVSLEAALCGSPAGRWRVRNYRLAE